MITLSIGPADEKKKDMEEMNNFPKAALYSTPRTSIADRLSLFKKPFLIQFMILGVWTAAAVMFLYYYIYESSTLEMVRARLLPRNIDWMLSTAIGLVIGGVILLLFPPDQKVTELGNVAENTPIIIKQCEAQILNQEFDIALETLKTHFDHIKALGLREGVETMADLVMRARINKNVKNTLNKFKADMSPQERLNNRPEFQLFLNYIQRERYFILNEMLGEVDDVFYKYYS